MNSISENNSSYDNVFLDCTLRDGGFHNNWDFSHEFIVGSIDAAIAANVDVMEVGYLKYPEEYDSSPLKIVSEILSSKDHSRLKIAIMIDYKNWHQFGDGIATTIEEALDKTDFNVDVIRFAMSSKADTGELSTAIKACNDLNRRGYLVCLNFMQITVLKDDEFRNLLNTLAEIDNDVVLYIADSLGSMEPNLVQHYFKQMKLALTNRLGFHAHNNLGLASINAHAALLSGASWIDATFAGLGRGAGNAPTEQIMSLMKNDCDYAVVWNFLDHEVEQLRALYDWGQSPIYALCADKGVHPSYGQYIASQKSMASDKQLDLIQQIALTDAKKFNQERVAELCGNAK